MTFSTNDRVYVRAPFRRGSGTVLRARSDGTVMVCLDAGLTVRAPVHHVSHLERQRTPAHKLTSQPSYTAPPLVAQEHEEAVRSSAYLGWIRRQPCAWCGASAPSEASHHPEEGHGAMAQKASDLDTLPLCRGCHAQWHAETRLGSMTSADTKGWCQVQIKRRVQAYLVDGGSL